MRKTLLAAEPGRPAKFPPGFKTIKGQNNKQKCEENSENLFTEKQIELDYSMKKRKNTSLPRCEIAVQQLSGKYVRGGSKEI